MFLINIVHATGNRDRLRQNWRTLRDKLIYNRSGMFRDGSNADVFASVQSAISLFPYVSWLLG